MLQLSSKHVPNKVSDHNPGSPIPTQNSSFSYSGTPVVDTHVHCTPGQRSQDKAQPVRPEEWWKAWKLLSTRVMQAVDLLREGKPAQIKQLHPNTALLKVCVL